MTRKALFDLIRPWLDGSEFTAARIAALDAWCDGAGLPKDGTEKPASAQSGGWLDNAALDHPAASTGLTDDRYLPVFQRVASPQADPATVTAMARSFAAHAPAYGQDGSKARIAEFVAQIANETGGFRRFEEDLRYRAETMLRQWPSHFTRAQAEAAVGNPIEIASRAYGGRMGNAPYPSQDGYTYRGRGALQLTGRDNYRRFGQLTGLPLEDQPSLAADPADSVLIALAFFKQGNVNAAIDAGDFTKARRITNGGSIGLAEVAAYRAKALEALK